MNHSRFIPNPFSLYDSDTEYSDITLLDYKSGKCEECCENKNVLHLKCTNECKICISCMRIIFKDKEDRQNVMKQLQTFLKSRISE